MPASIAFLLCFSERATILHGRTLRNFCKETTISPLRETIRQREGRGKEIDLVNHTWPSSTARGSRFWRSPSSQRSYTTTPMLKIKFIIRAAVLRDCISDGVCVGGRRRLWAVRIDVRNVEGSSEWVVCVGRLLITSKLLCRVL